MQPSWPPLHLQQRDSAVQQQAVVIARVHALHTRLFNKYPTPIVDNNV
jgi:hypothetical protein